MALLAVIISTVALLQTAKQTRLSNKHQLFDRRLEKYLFMKCLLTLYRKARSQLINDSINVYQEPECHFTTLTNCASLESMVAAMTTPLEGDAHKEFLIKIEMLDRYAREIELLWNNEEGRLVGHFVNQYKNLLMSLYRQQCWRNSFMDTMNKPQVHISLDTFQKKTEENAIAVGLFDAIFEIERTYNQIRDRDAEEHIVKSIHL